MNLHPDFSADSAVIKQPAADPRLWLHKPDLHFLNHGAFGSCPRAILEHQTEWRARMEQQPLQFLARDLEGHLDSARSALAQFVGSAPDDLVFVNNSTTGVNTVLRSLEFQPGDELLTTDQAYNACRNALNYVAERSGARVVVAKLPFPFQREEELIAPVIAAITSRTRLALLDHVTSPTGVVLPLKKLVQQLQEHGIDTLVDGAHAPGMLPLNLQQLGAAYYAGNCHKWLCGPKGAALLHVRRDRQHLIRPLTISHGANSRRTDRSRFLIEFAWVGTGDPTSFLSIPETLRFIGSLMPGGWPEVMSRNHALALAGRKILCDTLQVAAPCLEEFIGSLAAVPLPDAPSNALPQPPIYEYPLQNTLRLRHNIEVPIMPWPAPPKRLLRIAPHLYNSLPQYEKLAQAVMTELPGN